MMRIKKITVKKGDHPFIPLKTRDLLIKKPSRGRLLNHIPTYAKIFNDLGSKSFNYEK